MCHLYMLRMFFFNPHADVSEDIHTYIALRKKPSNVASPYSLVRTKPHKNPSRKSKTLTADWMHFLLPDER